MLTAIIGIVILLGGLIFFHEFGHYLVAKLFGVRVEVFSVGFGKKIFRRQIGETEYCVSIFPLGGYVKLMGDDPYKEVPAAEAHRAFSTQKLYKRFLIVAAGPLFNLILAYGLFIVVFWFGQPMASSRIGTIVVNSPAWNAGIRPKDRIVRIMDEPIASWNGMEELLKDKAGQKADVIIDRAGTELHVNLTISEVEARNFYGQDIMVGAIKGIHPNPLAAKIGISDPKSSAAVAGLKTGDIITKIGSTPIKIYPDVNEALLASWAKNSPVIITVERETEETSKEHSFSVMLPNQSTEGLSPFGAAKLLGIYPSELFVKSVSEGSPAEKAGLKPGDRVVRLNDQPIYNFETIVNQVQILGDRGETVDLELEREGEATILRMSPIKTTTEDPLTRQAVEKHMIGFAPQALLERAEMFYFKIRRPIPLVKHAVSETNLLAKRMLISLGKLVTGEISVKNLGGPVLIASVAGKSLNAGIIPFLQMMALISINLFLLNLFPIPILDGGHLLFFAVEGIKGSPVSIRTMEIANQLGMVFILLLVGLTLFNDISRMVLH